MQECIYIRIHHINHLQVSGSNHNNNSTNNKVSDNQESNKK